VSPCTDCKLQLVLTGRWKLSFSGGDVKKRHLRFVGYVVLNKKITLSHFCMLSVPGNYKARFSRSTRSYSWMVSRSIVLSNEKFNIWRGGTLRFLVFIEDILNILSGDESCSFFISGVPSQLDFRYLVIIDALPFSGSQIAQSVYGLGYGLNDCGIEVQFLAGTWACSLLHSFLVGFGIYPASYSMDSGACFPGEERLGREVDHSPYSRADIKYGSIYPSVPVHLSISSNFLGSCGLRDRQLSVCPPPPYRFVCHAVCVVSKESRRLVLPRTSCFLSDGEQFVFPFENWALELGFLYHRGSQNYIKRGGPAL
jgi:hypothetical protein